MIDATIERVKGFLLKPVESFQKYQADSIGTAFRYYVILLIGYTILTAIVGSISGIFIYSDLMNSFAQFGLPIGDVAGLSAFIISLNLVFVYLAFIILLFAIFLKGFFVHVFVLLFGGEKGYVQTMKVVLYANTPALILGWIPFINIIGGIWTFVLMILGIRECQELSTGRAVLVMIIPIVLGLILMVFILSTLISLLTIFGEFASMLSMLS